MEVKDGYFIFMAGENYQLTPHFNTKEFECKGGSDKSQRISIELIGCLEALRKDYKKPIKITSGFRTAEYQTKLRKNPKFETSKRTSTHELGDAADIAGDSIYRLRTFAGRYFDAIGMGSNFTHVDIRRDKNRCWTYGY